MKRLLSVIGVAAFWLGWPVWYVYFKHSSLRSRVLVVCGDEALLIKGWLSRGKWMLPGGGVGKRESTVAAAVRELKEEIDITTAESALQPVGRHISHFGGLQYKADYFILELQGLPDLKLQKHEIAEAKWFKLQDISSMQIDNEVAYVVKKYRPLNQIELPVTAS